MRGMEVGLTTWKEHFEMSIVQLYIVALAWGYQAYVTCVMWILPVHSLHAGFHQALIYKCKGDITPQLEFQYWFHKLGVCTPRNEWIIFWFNQLWLSQDKGSLTLQAGVPLVVSCHGYLSTNPRIPFSLLSQTGPPGAKKSTFSKKWTRSGQKWIKTSTKALSKVDKK